MTGSAIVALKPLPVEHRVGLDRILGQRPDIEAFAGRMVAQGLRNVFMVGSGGGLITFGPLQYDLERGTARFPAFAISANEFIYRHPAALGPGSLVLVASNTGTTPEVVAAAHFAREHGATVASSTRHADSALAAASDVTWAYEDDRGVGDPKHLAFAILGLALLREAGDLSAEDHTARMGALEALPDAMLAAVRSSEERTHAIAAALRDEPIIYVLGSGPNHATAYCLAMCYLQEMQWMHAASFDAAEFLHGAMEVVVDDVPVIQFLGEEATRPIDERAKAFLLKNTTNAHFIDARDLDLPGIDAALRPFASPYALSAVMSRLAQQFEAATGHALEIRRYMFKVEY